MVTNGTKLYPMVLNYTWCFCSHWLGNYLAKPTKLNLVNQNISMAWKLTHLVVPRTRFLDKELPHWRKKIMLYYRVSNLLHYAQLYLSGLATPSHPQMTPHPKTLPRYTPAIYQLLPTLYGLVNFRLIIYLPGWGGWLYRDYIANLNLTWTETWLISCNWAWQHPIPISPSYWTMCGGRNM